MKRHHFIIALLLYCFFPLRLGLKVSLNKNRCGKKRSMTRLFPSQTQRRGLTSLA